MDNKLHQRGSIRKSTRKLVPKRSSATKRGNSSSDSLQLGCGGDSTPSQAHQSELSTVVKRSELSKSLQKPKLDTLKRHAAIKRKRSVTHSQGEKKRKPSAGERSGAPSNYSVKLGRSLQMPHGEDIDGGSDVIAHQNPSRSTEKEVQFRSSSIQKPNEIIPDTFPPRKGMKEATTKSCSVERGARPVDSLETKGSADHSVAEFELVCTDSPADKIAEEEEKERNGCAPASFDFNFISDDDEEQPRQVVRSNTQTVPHGDVIRSETGVEFQSQHGKAIQDSGQGGDIVEEEWIASGEEDEQGSLCGSDKSYELSVGDANEFEEGEENEANNSDFDGEDDPLFMALMSQRERRAEEEPISRSATGVASMLSRNPPSRRRTKPSIGNLKEEWEIEYQRKPLSFFSTAEARLEVDQEIVQLANGDYRAEAYPGIRVSEMNNSDIKYKYTIAFKPRHPGDRSRQKTYENFLTCMGQMARAGIALKKLSVHNLWKPGELFKIADNTSFFHLFVGHFSHTSPPTTVGNKEAQLGKFIQFAIRYFGAHPKYPEDPIKNNTMDMKISGVLAFLRQDRSLNKSAALRIRQKTKEDWHRSAAGKFISEEMFDYMRTVAIDALKGILKTVQEKCQEKEATDFSAQTKVFEDLMLKKYNLVKNGA